jgi:Domain of unknown function (DUF3846)
MRVKNAQHIKTDGTVTEVKPKDGSDNFSLKELQDFVGGLIEYCRAKDGRIIVMNENGLNLKLPPNRKATDLYDGGASGITLVGDVLICDRLD